MPSKIHPEHGVRYWTWQRMKVPPLAHPLVRRLYAELIRQQVPVRVLSDKSGVSRQTIREWRTRTRPKLEDIEACFNVLGYELTLKETE